MSGVLTTAAPMLSVFDGRVCVGFILARGKTGFELFDTSQRSLGFFPTQAEAVAALSDAGVQP